jgi:hypothetical protein
VVTSKLTKVLGAHRRKKRRREGGGIPGQLLGDGGGAPTSIARIRRILLLAAVATVLAVQRINAHGRCSVKCNEKKGVPCHAGVDVLVRAWVQCGCGLVLIKGQKCEED